MNYAYINIKKEGDIMTSNGDTFDVILSEYPSDETGIEVSTLSKIGEITHNNYSDSYVLLSNIEGPCSCAAGLATVDAMETINIDRKAFESFIINIISDVANESDDSTYFFKNLTIYLARL